jgi:hypothetical protein
MARKVFLKSATLSTRNHIILIKIFKRTEGDFQVEGKSTEEYV